MDLLVLRPNNIPLVLALVLVLLDNIPGIRAAVEDVLALRLAADLNVAVERFGHCDDVRVGFVPGDGVGISDGSFAAFHGEGPEEGAEEGYQLGLGEVDAGAGAVAVAEGGVAAKVGVFGQGLFVGWVGGVDPAFGFEFGWVGVEGFFAGNQAGGIG